MSGRCKAPSTTSAGRDAFHRVPISSGTSVSRSVQRPEMLASLALLRSNWERGETRPYRAQWLNTNSAEFSSAQRMSSVADWRVASFAEKAFSAKAISSDVGLRL